MGNEKTNIPKSIQIFLEFLKFITISEIKTKMYLRTEGNPSLVENVKDFITCCDNVARIYSCPIEDWEKIREICVDFPFLSKILKHSDFSDKDISEILFYLIRKNLASGLVECPNIILEQKDLENFPFRDVSAQEVYQFITTDAFYHASHKKEEELSQKERILLRELKRCSKEYRNTLDEVLSYHQTIQTHYFEKSDCFDFEDIALVIEALKNLKVSAFVLDSVNKALRKELRQRNSGIYAFASEESSTHEEEGLLIKKVKKKKQERERQRQEREAFLLAENKKRRDEKAIYKLMSDIYGIESREFHVIPTDAVILKWVSYAKNVQLPLSTILQFLIDAYRQISTMDPVVQYGILYKKLKYYEEAVGISNELKELEQYLDALLEAGATYTFLVKEKKQQAIDDSGLQEQGEEISFWEGELQKKLEQTLELVPKDYDYEIKH